MKSPLAIGAASLLVLAAACSPQAPAPAASAPAAPAAAAAFQVSFDMKEFMGHAVDATADMIWLNQGWIIDKDGEREYFPTTDEGWLHASNAGVIMAELANAMMVPGRGNSDEKLWQDYAAALHRAAIRSHEAAEKKEKQEFFDAGGAIYEVCRDCHQRYILGDENAPPPPK